MGMASRMMDARAAGRRSWGLFNAFSVSVLRDGGVTKTGAGDDRTRYERM